MSIPARCPSSILPREGSWRWRGRLTIDMLTLNQPPLTQHISIPKDMSQLSVEAFTAGIVEGVLDALDVVSSGIDLGTALRDSRHE